MTGGKGSSEGSRVVFRPTTVDNHYSCFESGGGQDRRLQGLLVKGEDDEIRSHPEISFLFLSLLSLFLVESMRRNKDISRKPSPFPSSQKNISL